MICRIISTSKGNFFVIFGEPDIDIIHGDEDKIQVKINGVDVFQAPLES